MRDDLMIVLIEFHASGMVNQRKVKPGNCFLVHFGSKCVDYAYVESSTERVI